jgi:hypothetical protein
LAMSSCPLLLPKCNTYRIRNRTRVEKSALESSQLGALHSPPNSCR